MKKDQLFDFVRTTTSLASESGVVDRAKQAKQVIKSTQKTYDKIAAARLDLDRMDCGALMDGVTARSWHAVKAGLLHVSSQRYIAERKLCDDAQRSGDYETAAIHAVLARRAVEAIQRVEGAERPDLIGRRSTKRRTLPNSEDWQQRVYEAATTAQRPAVAVMWATGARPDEVEKGVVVEWGEHKASNKDYLMITISGAKVTEMSGQEERIIVIDPDSKAGKVLSDQMDDKQKIIIQRGAKRLNKDFAVIREKTGLKVSPYSMRHQFSANLKAELGSDQADKIAQAMGHATTRSQGRYGSVKQAQSGTSGVFRVQASRRIKETRSSLGPKNTGPKSSPGLSN